MEGDWTPTKTKLSQLATYRGGSLICFQDEKEKFLITGVVSGRMLRIRPRRSKNARGVLACDSPLLHFPVRYHYRRDDIEENSGSP